MVSIENLEILKYQAFSVKTLVHSIIYSKCKDEEEKVFKEEESIEILKIISFIKGIYF